MQISYQSLATVTAVICFSLAGIWLLVPKRLLSVWGIPFSQPVGVVSRRGGALFLGIGVMFFMTRHIPLSPERTALSVGFTVACFTLASLGMLEFLTKQARVGILLAVVVELSLAIAFLFQLTFQ